MKIQEIFNLAIKMGIDADFRSNAVVENLLKRKKERYKSLSADKKADFDEEALTNPYLDSRILNVSKDKEIKKIFVGIDIDTAELMLAKEMGADLVIGHHPRGKALATLQEVMEMQCDVLNKYGVPINVAEGLMKKKISEVGRGVNSANHERAVDSARLLGMNFINCHTPCDNLAAKFLSDKIEKAKPERLEDLVSLLKGIEEYKQAQKLGAGPRIFVGSLESRCGRIAMSEITGGTEGSPKIYEKLAQAGIGTVVSMHQSEEHRKEAEAANINVVIAGHMSSDSLGVNLFLDKLEKKGIEIIPYSGLIRVSRNK
jgi:putative NIF3 family GTP cyclohydrolase 1 type 2